MPNYSYPTNKYALHRKDEAATATIETADDKEDQQTLQQEAKQRGIAPLLALTTNTSVSDLPSENRSTLHLTPQRK
jgi:hypothetical protein